MKSPCIQVCKLHPTLKLCVGCFRTIDEIGMWAGMKEEQQARTIALAQVRAVSYKLHQKINNRRDGK